MTYLQTIQFIKESVRLSCQSLSQAHVASVRQPDSSSITAPHGTCSTTHATNQTGKIDRFVETKQTATSKMSGKIGRIVEPKLSPTPIYQKIFAHIKNKLLPKRVDETVVETMSLRCLAQEDGVLVKRRRVMVVTK